MKSLISTRRYTAAFCALLLSTSSYAANIDDYLLIGRGDVNIGAAVGASSPNTLGLVDNSGNVAVTNGTGRFDFSTTNIGATIGVDCQGSLSACNDGFSDSSIVGGGTLNYGVDLTGLESSINSAENYIEQAFLNNLGTAIVIDTTGGKPDTSSINLVSGLNLVTFSETNADISFENNFTFNGPADAFAIVLVPDGKKLKSSGADLLNGTGSLDNLVIAALGAGEGADIDMSGGMNINGIALWNLRSGNGDIVFNNVDGCTQLISNKINLNDVNLNRCAFNTSVVPIPAAAWLFGSGLIGLVAIKRKRR